MIIRAKIADTPHKLEQGLMFKTHLDEDEGMLFVFSSPKKLNFWGKNTFIPLDIAFIDKKDKIVHIDKIKPHDQESVSCDNCIMALEVSSGFFKKYNIRVGDSVDVDWGGKEALITFVNKNSEKYAAEINKQNEEPIGEPIGGPIETVDQNQLQNLPVIDTSSLGDILEDSIDEEIDEPDGTDETPTDEEPIEEAPTEEVEEIKEEIWPTEEKKYPVFSTAFEATEWAEKNNEVIRIEYTTKRGRYLVRDVEPHGSFHSDSTKRQILVTFDETVGNIRAFIVTNIGSWGFIGKKFNRKFTVRA